MNDNFLTLDEFRRAMQSVEPVFFLNRRLPDQVFKHPYRFHLLSEFDNGMGGFLEVLRKMRSPLARETVLLNVLEPDPITFFYKEFQKIYAFYFRADISEAEYYSMRWIEPSSEADPFPFHTEVETYFPSSESWAMWGERSREIAVVGLDDPALAAYLVNKNGYWMDAETASNEFASMPYPHQKMPQDFKRALIANYGSRAGLEKKLGQRVKYPWEQEEAPSRD